MERRGLRSNPLLRSRDGRLFLGSQALDATSNGVASVALPWLVLDATGSKAAAGFIFAVEVLPYVVFGLPAGLAGDRLPRRQLIATAHAVQTLLALVIPIWAFTSDTPPVLVVAVVAFMIGAARAFVDAGAFGAVASLVGPRHFTGGQSILSAAWSLGLLTGPSLGGALIAWIGPAKTIAVQAASFALAAVLILIVRGDLGRGALRAQARVMDGIAEGVRFLLDDPLLRTLTVVGIGWNLVSAGAIALIVPLLRKEIGLSAESAGLVLAAGAAMGIVSAPVVHALERVITGWRLYVATVFLSAPATAALGLAYGPWLALLANLLASLVNWVVMAVFIGERQRRAPEHLQARVGISGRMLMTGSMAIGAGLASALTTFVDLRLLYVGMGGAIALVGAAAVPLLRRAARHPAVAAD